MNFSTNELLLLKYINKTKENSPIPKYFTSRYNLNVDNCIKLFWDYGLIEYASLNDTLEHCSVQQLKDILLKHNLRTSGNKSTLITKIIENIDTSTLVVGLDKYISLTDKGEQLLNNNLSQEEYDNRYLVERHIPTFEERYAKSYEELQSLQKLNSNKHITFVYTIRTMDDNAVCEHCAALEGKRFNITDAVIGVNYPPFKNCKCDYCRCFASSHIEIIENEN